MSTILLAATFAAGRRTKIFNFQWFIWVMILAFSEENYCSDDNQQSVVSCARQLYDLGAFKESSNDLFTWNLFTAKNNQFLTSVCKWVQC